MKFRDRSQIESGYLKTVPAAQQNRAEEYYTVIPSRPLCDFYINRTDNFGCFDIVLGDWGVSSWTYKHLTENIQPVALRSPEVLIKAPWGPSTDFWNIGAVILELFRAIRMFDGRGPPDGHYDLRTHLAEIVDLFGPFPRALLVKGDQDIVQDMFDEEGKVRDFPPLERPGLNTEVWMPGLEQDVRDEFVSFLSAMMRIDPAERPSAEDLLRHPWLGALHPVG